MNYRSVADLNTTIKSGLSLVPADADVIVGIPRSGMLVANLLALHLNLPLTDVEGLIAGRLLQSGRRRGDLDSAHPFGRMKKAVVVDDSVLSGGQLRKTKAQLQSLNDKLQLVYGAAYVDDVSQHFVDFYFEKISPPRAFEWNLMHHPTVLRSACVDIDGVLCVDPTAEQNDDGERYLQFLSNAVPFLRSTVKIGWLVTSRLEKYRQPTIQWLAANDIHYEHLVMLDLPDGQTRRRMRAHGLFKGSVYRGIPATLFIESDPAQAPEIAAVAGKPVLCIQNGELHTPTPLEAPEYVWRQLRKRIRLTTRALKYRYFGRHWRPRV